MIDCIVVAAGQGRRMGAGGNKLYLPLCGKPILYYTLANLAALPQISRIFPIIRQDELELFQGLEPLDKLQAPVWGAAERPDSVREGLKALLAKGQASIVMVHDGARPFIDEALIQRLAKAAQGACALPVLPVADTVREVDQAGQSLPTRPGDSTKVLDRSRLFLAQTPQAFPRKWVEEVFLQEAALRQKLTDEGSYFEALGKPVVLVEGRAENFKITYPSDLLRAEAILAGGKCLGSRKGKRFV